MSEVCEERRGHAQVALSIFEVDRIDLVRHCRRSDLPSDVLLTEVAEADVGPHIAAEVNQDSIHVREDQTLLGDAIMRLNLRSVRVPLDTHVFNELT